MKVSKRLIDSLSLINISFQRSDSRETKSKTKFYLRVCLRSKLQSNCLRSRRNHCIFFLNIIVIEFLIIRPERSFFEKKSQKENGEINPFTCHIVYHRNGFYTLGLAILPYGVIILAIFDVRRARKYYTLVHKCPSFF